MRDLRVYLIWYYICIWKVIVAILLFASHSSSIKPSAFVRYDVNNIGYGFCIHPKIASIVRANHKIKCNFDSNRIVTLYYKSVVMLMHLTDLRTTEKIFSTLFIELILPNIFRFIFFFFWYLLYKSRFDLYRFCVSGRVTYIFTASISPTNSKLLFIYKKY